MTRSSRGKRKAARRKSKRLAVAAVPLPEPVDLVAIQWPKDLPPTKIPVAVMKDNRTVWVHFTDWIKSL